MDPIVHFELAVDDLDTARDFYGSLFDWKLDDWNMPDGSTYVGVHTTPIDEQTRMPLKPGAINGGIMLRNKQVENVRGAIVAINVASIDDKLEEARKKGATVVMPKTDVMGMGFYAYLNDPFDNLIGLWEDLKK